MCGSGLIVLRERWRIYIARCPRSGAAWHDLLCANTPLLLVSLGTTPF
jgi:hypothetical protein